MKIIEENSDNEEVMVSFSEYEIATIGWALDICRDEQRIDAKFRDDFQELFECFSAINAYRSISNVAEMTHRARTMGVSQMNAEKVFD